MSQQEEEIRLEPIRLAHVPPFRLGAVEVHPPTRQLIRDGISETLEPRVMQVLVALAKANGAIMTRDELIDRCWEGRVVSENAINRVISRVRQVASEIGADSFQLETITKVGYRMLIGGTQKSRALSADRPADAVPVSRRFAMIAAAAAAAGATGLLLAPWGKRSARAEAQAFVEKGRELLGYGLPDRSEQALSYFREATRIDPGYVDAWGILALTEDSPDRKRSAARRALELDPGNGDASAALVLIVPPFGNWARCEKGYRGFLRRFPDHSWVQWALANLLCEVGRWTDAIDELTEISEREPFLPIVRYRLINALWSAGRLQDADNALDEAMARWPRHAAIWETRFRLLAYTGRAATALAFAEDRSTRPIDYDIEEFEPAIAVARALASGAPTDVEAAVALNLRMAEQRPYNVHAAALHCAGLGRIEEAFALYEGYYFGRGRWAAAYAPNPRTKGTLFLFYPATAGLRADERFAALVGAIGLERYWQGSGALPDYRMS